VIVTPDDMIEIAAWPVDSVVDLTGAGDLYASGFLYGYTHGQDLAACGRIATLAAGEVISHIGARPETPLAELVLSRIL
jgi:sugar/nucleoside kinase (ribokinase family)